MIAWVGDDAMPAMTELGRWVWVTDAPYPFWYHLDEHQLAAETLKAAGVLPEVQLEELPA